MLYPECYVIKTGPCVIIIFPLQVQKHAFCCQFVKVYGKKGGCLQLHKHLQHKLRIKAIY